MHNSVSDDNLLLERCKLFLASIGIDVLEEHFEENSFLPGLKIRNGKLIINKEKLLYPGDILHEAGHIAVSAAERRPLLNNDIMIGQPENQGEELAVMLWSYAACLHLELDPSVVFHKDGYKGDSEWILNNYRNKTFIGLPLLLWMGLADPPEKKNGFPVMTKWLRD